MNQLSMRNLSWPLRATAALLALSTMFACTTEASDDTGDDNGGAAGTGGTGGTSGGGSDCGVGGNGSTLMCPDGAKACTQLVIPEQQCSFTQSEALAGIDIA